MNLKEKEGLTLIELLVAVYILLVGMGGILGIFINTMISAESSWDTTTATSHAQYILEEMQSKTTLAEIELIHWDRWAQEKKLITLPEEVIIVSYADPTADPLDIEVIDQWKRKLRTNKVTLRTKLTK